MIKRYCITFTCIRKSTEATSNNKAKLEFFLMSDCIGQSQHLTTSIVALFSKRSEKTTCILLIKQFPAYKRKFQKTTLPEPKKSSTVATLKQKRVFYLWNKQRKMKMRHKQRILKRKVFPYINFVKEWLFKTGNKKYLVGKLVSNIVRFGKYQREKSSCGNVTPCSGILQIFVILRNC